MSYFKRFTLPLVCIVSASVCLLPSAAQADPVELTACKTYASNYDEIMKGIRAVPLGSKGMSYNGNISSLLTIQSSAKVFISSLPAKKPTDKAGIAAYNRIKIQEAKAVDKLAANAEEDLQRLVSRAETDVEDTEAERTTNIDQTATKGYADLEIARTCQEWTATNTHIADSRALEVTYNNTLALNDQCLLKGSSPNPAVPCPAGYDGKAQRGLQGAYNVAAAKALAESKAHQQLCGKDPSYDYNDTTGDWASNSVIIPRVSGQLPSAARTKLTLAGFTKIVIKGVNSNDSKVGNSVGTDPAAGTPQAKAKAITILVRSNKKNIKGLPKGHTAPATSAVVIAAKAKKPKSKPLPKVKPPSAAAVAACRDNQQTDPQYGSDADLLKAELDLEEDQEDLDITYIQQTQAADTLYSQSQENLDRNLANPFLFAIPYDDAVLDLDQMVETTELRSDRKTTTDEWLVEDAATNAQRYLSDLYNRDIEL